MMFLNRRNGSSEPSQWPPRSLSPVSALALHRRVSPLSPNRSRNAPFLPFSLKRCNTLCEAAQQPPPNRRKAQGGR
eukprot:3386191-Rhodomonas_salina.1